MASSVYSRTLQKAAELAGGRKALAKALRVPLSDLEGWIADREAPPTQIFLKAVDLVLEDTSPSPGGEPGEPPAPRDCTARI